MIFWHSGWIWKTRTHESIWKTLNIWLEMSVSAGGLVKPGYMLPPEMLTVNV